MLLHVSCDIKTSLLVVVPVWSNADSVVLGVCVSACELLGGVPYATTLEVHAVSLINSWCAWKA